MAIRCSMSAALPGRFSPSFRKLIEELLLEKNRGIQRLILSRTDVERVSTATLSLEGRLISMHPL
jgi:hypothetical protein